MVDVGHKPAVARIAVASGRLHLQPSTRQAILSGTVPKGDVRATAAVAATMAVKNTPQLIPLCHPIPISGTDVELHADDVGVLVRVTVKATYRTGVEMEALAGVCAGLLTVWDMVKPLEKAADGTYPHCAISDVHVERKDKGAPPQG